jgi:hypothetical protein
MIACQTSQLTPKEVRELRNRITKSGLSQNAFAEQVCNLAPSTLWRALNGDNLSRRNLDIIRQVLNPAFVAVESVRIVTSEDLLQSGKRSIDILNEVMAIDASIPGVQPHSPPPHVVEAYNHHYHTYPELCPYLVTEENKIVGYFGILPLVDPAFDDLMKGASSESVSRLANIPPLGLCGPCDAYINGLALLDSWRTLANRRLLFAEIPKMLYRMTQQDVYFKRFGAHAWSPEGKQFIEALEMQPVVESAEGWFYMRSSNPFPETPLFGDKRILRRYQKVGLA